MIACICRYIHRVETLKEDTYRCTGLLRASLKTYERGWGRSKGELDRLRGHGFLRSNLPCSASGRDAPAPAPWHSASFPAPDCGLGTSLCPAEPTEKTVGPTPGTPGFQPWTHAREHPHQLGQLGHQSLFTLRPFS